MNQYSYGTPTLTKINKIILITTGVIFLTAAILKAIGAFSLLNILGLTGQGLFGGHVYRLLTYPLIETDLMGVLFNSMVIWFIGSELETQWGQKIYLRFLLVITLGVGLLYVLGSLLFYGTYVQGAVLHGLTGINLAFLVAYAILYQDRPLSFMMLFPLKSSTFCWILVGIEVYLAIFSSVSTSWAHLLSMGFSYLLVKFQTKSFVQRVLKGSEEKKTHRKGHLYVVKDDDQDPPKYWQ